MAKKRSHPTHPTKPKPAVYTPPPISDAELFQPQPETTPLPAVLATVISLTLHGLLWAAPPILSMSREKPDLQRTVELVQLTPEEISRLPQFSNSELSLPPLPPSLPSTDVLPPASPLQPPSTQTLERQEELVRQRIVQRQQELLQRKLRQQEELFQERVRQQEELLKKQRLEQQQQLQQEREEEKQRQAQQQRLLQEQEKQKQAELERLREQDKKRQQQLQREIDEQNKRQEAIRRQRELEVLQEWEQQNKIFAQVEKQIQRQQRLEGIKAVYGHQPSNMTDTEREKEGSEKFTNWFQEKFTQFPGIKLNHEPEIREIPSTAKVQFRDITPAAVAVVVNPEGKPEGEPLLMMSTSYSSLNQVVLDDAKKRSFEPTGKYEIYTYRVKIDESNLPLP